MTRARALCAAGALAVALACGDGKGRGSAAGAAATSAPEAPALGPVVAEAIAALEAGLPGTAALDPATVAAVEQPVAELVAALAEASERDSLRRTLLEELVGYGPAAVPHLECLLGDRQGDARRRTVAAEALGALDTRAASAALLAQLEAPRTEVEPESWLAAQCAWRLSRTTQDWVVPRVILCLKYEKDHETVLWLADALAHFGNYGGLEALRVVAAGDSPTRERAAGLYAELAARAGLAGGAELERAWAGLSAPAPPAPAPSPELELETWRWIQALGEWQLRGVDDARFVLSHSGPAAAAQLACALSDENVYIRVHSAQCLERMGPRGRAAVPALARALADARVAPAAAAALGAIGEGAALDPLAAVLGAGHDLELRVAAARALGALGEPGARAARAALVHGPAEPVDLRAAVAGAQARAAPAAEADEAVRYLVELFGTGAVDEAEIEAALGAWVARRAGNGGTDGGADELRAAWEGAAELEGPARCAARAAAIRAALEPPAGE